MPFPGKPPFSAGRTMTETAEMFKKGVSGHQSGKTASWPNGLQKFALDPIPTKTSQ